MIFDLRIKRMHNNDYSFHISKRESRTSVKFVLSCQSYPYKLSYLLCDKTRHWVGVIILPEEEVQIEFQDGVQTIKFPNVSSPLIHAILDTEQPFSQHANSETQFVSQT